LPSRFQITPARDKQHAHDGATADAVHLMTL
jgi:hypothetical protein